MQNLKNKQMNKHYKRNKSTENRGVVSRREGVGGGETGVKGIKRYRLLGITQISYKNVMYSTGNIANI